MKHRFLGDAVLATALLNAVEVNGQKGEAWASVLLADLLEGTTPSLPRIPIGKASGAGEFLRLVRRARKGRFGTAILVNRNWRSALVSKLAGIPIRVGHTTEGRAALLTHKVAYDETRSERESYLDLARALGIPVDNAKIGLATSDAERAFGKEALQGATVGIQPGSTHGRKALPPQVVTALVEAARAKGRRVAFFGGPEERGYLEGLEADVDLVGTCRLRQTMGALAGLEAFVAGDTGLVHISAALGIPTVAAYTSGLPASKWGHFEPPHFNFQCNEDTLANLEPPVLTQPLEQLLG